MKLSITEMYELQKAQQNYDKQKKRVFKLSLLFVKNGKILKEAIDSFEEARDSIVKSEKFNTYQKERQELVDSHRIKRTDGGFITEQQNGQMVYKLDRLPELEGKLKEFDAPHKEMLDKAAENHKAAVASMDEKQTIKLQSITSMEQVKALEVSTLVSIAPLIKVTLTENYLEKVGNTLTTSEINRLFAYCDIK